MNHNQISIGAYTAYLSIISFQRNRKLNLILTLSLALGLTLPMLCLGNINVFVQNIDTVRLQDSENMYLVETRGGQTGFEALEQSLCAALPEIDAAAASYYSQAAVEINGIKQNMYVVYASEGLLEMEAFTENSGKLELPPGSSQCLVEQSLLEEYGEISIGGTLMAAGVPYEVAGIFSSIRYYGKILLPISSQTEKQQEALQLSRLYLHTTGPLDEALLTQTLAESEIIVNEVLQGDKLSRQWIIAGIRQSMFIFAVGIAGFAFAAINLCLVLTGRIMQERRVLGIKMAMGASYGQIFFASFVENLVCLCAAFCLDIALLPLLKTTCPKELKLIFDGSVYGGSFLFGALMVLLIVWAATWKLKRKKPVELMERVL